MVSIKLKFRPSTIDGKEGSLYYQVIYKRVIRQIATHYKIMPNEWYKNEIETYEAELENGIPRTEAYEADLHFMLWKYQELYNYTNQK